MTEISRNDADLLLRMLYTNGAWYLGLARDADGREEDDAGYARQPLRLSEPRGEGLRYVENTELVTFPSYAAPAKEPITHAIVATAPAGGDVKLVEVLRDADGNEAPRTAIRGDHLIFAPGTFRIGVP